MNHLELFHYAVAVLRFVRARGSRSLKLTTSTTLTTLRALVGIGVLALVACTPPGETPHDGETVRFAVKGFSLDPRDTLSSDAVDLDGQGARYDNRVGVTVQFLAQLVLRGGTTLASLDDIELALGPDAPVYARVPLPLFAATYGDSASNARSIDAYDLRLELDANRERGSLCGALLLDDFVAVLVDAVAERLAVMPDRGAAPLPFVDEDRDGAIGTREIAQLLGGGDLSLDTNGAIGPRGNDQRPAISFAIRFTLAPLATTGEHPVTGR